MSVLEDVLTLLTTPPGGMAYYLILLFSIWAIVGLALSRWSRGERRDIVPRLLVAGAILSSGRLAFFLLALIDRAGSVQSPSYLILLGPPLERFLDTLSILLICWAVVIPPQQRTLSRVFIGVTLFLAAGLYLIGAMQWASTFQADASALYNLSWQRWAWELSQLLLLIGALGYLLVVPVPERGTIIVLLVVLAIGHLLQAAIPLPNEIPHFAAWVRFAHLLAFPLLAVIAFRLIVQRFEVQAANLQSINRESLSQITGLMNLLDTNQKMATSLDLDAVLETAIRSVSQTLSSDLCAVALLDPESNDTGELSICYNAPDMIKSPKRFNVEDYPAIQHAITRSKPVTFDPDNNGSATEIYQLLGSQESGPLIVQPLVHDARVSGMILVCQPRQSTPFNAVQVRKCETLATPIALAILNARQYRQTQAYVEQQTNSLRALDKEFSRTRTDLENRLKKAQDEIAVYVQKLYETELAEQRAQNDARELRQQLNRTKQSGQENAPEIENRLNESLAQVVLLNKRIATLDTARSQLEQQVLDLEEERKQWRAQLSKAEASYMSLRAHNRQLQERLARGSQQQPDVLNTAALDSIPHGIIVCNIQGQVVHANPVAAQRLSLQQAAWKGQDAVSLWPDKEWQAAVHAVTDQYSTQAPLVHPLQMDRPLHGLQITLAPLRSEGQHTGAVIVLQDMAALDERTRARDEFLSSLAHELRTPMTSILGYTELLMSESVGRLEGMQRKFLQRVQANIERMGAMLNDLIGVTAIDSAKLDIELEPVDVIRVVESALRKIQFRLEERELNTHVQIGDISPISADPEHLQQMVDNLLTNACTSSAAGTTINIIAHQETDETGRSHLHVAVSDTGGGISPEYRSRVFERFYRADNALIEGLGETGVGLSIVKALVEAHHGHVWIESRMGEGTTFHFTIPFDLEQRMRGNRNSHLAAQRRGAGDNGHA